MISPEGGSAEVDQKQQFLEAFRTLIEGGAKPWGASLILTDLQWEWGDEYLDEHPHEVSPGESRAEPRIDPEPA